jgi:hypothetical protein
MSKQRTYHVLATILLAVEPLQLRWSELVTTVIAIILVAILLLLASPLLSS